MKTFLTFGSAIALATIAVQPACAASKTEAALLGAVLGQALGGSTKLGENGGEIEGWMIAAPLLESAAKKIKASIDSNAKGILLVGDESPNLGLAASISTQAARLSQRFDGVCPSIQKGVTWMSGPVGTAIAAAISGAPKPSTSIEGFTLAPGDQALINAINNAMHGKWSRLDDVVMTSTDTPLQRSWSDLRSKRNIFAQTKCAESDRGKAIIAEFDALETQLLSMGETGLPSLFDQALRIEAALRTGPNVLRVNIEKAGGSVINTDNIWTRLGVPAVSLTGAVVVGYRLITPATGTSTHGGLIVCHSPRRSMGAIHKGQLPSGLASNCEPAPSRRGGS